MIKGAEQVEVELKSPDRRRACTFRPVSQAGRVGLHRKLANSTRALFLLLLPVCMPSKMMNRGPLGTVCERIFTPKDRTKGR
jgi:hypothetical protein